jgi:hypothetical protein
MRTHLTTFLLAALLITVEGSAQELTNSNIIAMSAWSEPTGSSNDTDSWPIRARLIVCYGYSPRYTGARPETQVYLEIQNVSDTALQIYCDFENGLQGELRDINSKQVTSGGGPGSGTFPPASWVTLPYDATIRLRASWFGYGMPRHNGLMIPLYRKLIIRPGDPNAYALHATFTVVPPTNHVCPPGYHVWQGKVALPAMSISAQQP